MKTHPPSWHLKVTCPCCGQGGPLLICCPQCDYIAAACEEILGRYFLDPRNLMESFCEDEELQCPQCSAAALKDFTIANDTQISEAGLSDACE